MELEEFEKQEVRSKQYPSIARSSLCNIWPQLARILSFSSSDEIQDISIEHVGQTGKVMATCTFKFNKEDVKITTSDTYETKQLAATKALVDLISQDERYLLAQDLFDDDSE